MAGPLIPRKPTITITYTPEGGGAAETVDLSCYVNAVDIGSDAETIDVGTFCAPGATEIGKVTDSIVLSTLWSPELYAALEPHLNEEGHLVLKLTDTDTKGIQADVKYSSLPWGRFVAGERVEDDLTLAVLSAIEYDTLPVAAP
jgi:hypothetical protein